MSITTKQGDRGETGRFGGGRIAKTDPRICAVGAIDELNSAIGLFSARPDVPAEVRSLIKRIQETCFVIGSHLSVTPSAPDGVYERIPRLGKEDITFLEREIERMEATTSVQRHFILPGGSPAASMCFWIRSVVRRAERDLFKAHEIEPLDEHILAFMNRMSDFWYALGRYLNHLSGTEEVDWQGSN